MGGGLEFEGKGKGKRNTHLTDASHFPDTAEAIARRRKLNAPTLPPAIELRANVKKVGRDCWGITAGGGGSHGTCHGVAVHASLGECFSREPRTL